jgi:transposase
MLNVINTAIWLYQEPVDFRKQLDSLIILVSGKLKKDPASGNWFIFRNKQGNKLKIIVWEHNGFWMLYKRIEKGRFQLPKKEDKQMTVTPHQLSWLLSGISMDQISALKELKPAIFY